MRRFPLKWALVGLVAVFALGGVAWASGEGVRPAFLANSTPASPDCGIPETAVRAFAARLGIDASVIAQPMELCNCNTDAECKGICDSGAGFCGIFLACPGDPPKYVGSCFCKRTPVTPVPVEP